MTKQRSILLLAAMSWISWVACSHAAPTSETTPSASGAVTASAATIKTQEVDYEAGGAPLKGFLAYPAHLTGKAPGVLVVHEWWGLNDYVRSRAKQLAELGYVAMAIDMYGEGKVAAHPDEAKKFVGEVFANLDVGVARFEAGMNTLRAFEHTDAEKIAAIGYCFGGAVVLHMARLGKDLDVVASFHGSLPTQTPMTKDKFQGRVFVANGADDSFVTAEQLKAFEEEMNAAGARYEVVSYAGAKHGFTNPEATETGKATGMPIAYDAKADAESWHKLEQILKEAWLAPSPWKT
jgi:dienelactone hydrolase